MAYHYAIALMIPKNALGITCWIKHKIVRFCPECNPISGGNSSTQTGTKFTLVTTNFLAFYMLKISGMQAFFTK
ncbi:hypothetical protein D210916BOD24_16040 [Alteromonas sp. D210916BOD_24]